MMEYEPHQRTAVAIGLTDDEGFWIEEINKISSLKPELFKWNSWLFLNEMSMLHRLPIITFDNKEWRHVSVLEVWLVNSFLVVRSRKDRLIKQGKTMSFDASQ